MEIGEEFGEKKTAIFIVPRQSTAWKGNEAGWITASGWAAANQEMWGETFVCTTDGVFTPQESRLFPKISNHSHSIPKFYRNLIPEILITAIKDYKLKKSKPPIWPIEDPKWLERKKLMMVWERHDLFAGPGKRLAEMHKVPFVISVEALAVWEARKWGVKRPIWGEWLEKNYEAKSLKGADLITCVSDEVKDKVISLGINPNKVIVSPNRVDSTIFHPNVNGEKVKEKYNLYGKKVIGWTGSFRSFHGLDNVVYAFNELTTTHPDLVLMLVGDGLEYINIKNLISKLKISDKVILTGKQSIEDIPQYLKNFDIGLVSAASADGFHYSPLKLREYLAVGLPVIAPRAGNLPHLFKDGEDLLLYKPGDIKDLAHKIDSILSNTNLKEMLISKAIASFESEGTWMHELKKIIKVLGLNV